ncbi:hypothetical protein [Actinomadura harenae]|uniref:DUF485 domain-containing protein n=1 Tax=Actinomadura harenae TaxID=2483351 RepID=A0A3M2LTS4_9ACTN|nr:hypothetical protein [Actinomadura harenae]RMI40516.1 hypothetical protein EBO15_26345 [Actinomadura harenae]
MTEPRPSVPEPRPGETPALDPHGGTPPRRVVVANPRTRVARSVPPPDAGEPYAGEPYAGPYTGTGWNYATDLDEQTELGAVFARTLIRAQLRTALGTGGLVLGVVALLPLLAFVPGGAHAGPIGLPLPWLVLAAGIQPLWVYAARRQARLAETAEHDFARLVGRP